jgi:hypothetical protein
MFLLSLLPPGALAPLPPPPHTIAQSTRGDKPASAKQRAALINRCMRGVKDSLSDAGLTDEELALYRARIEEVAVPGLSEDAIKARICNLRHEWFVPPEDGTFLFNRRMLRKGAAAFSD